MRRFCSIGTSASGTSMPRSPRATMIPPVAAATISSTFTAACWRSIFATSGMSEPRLRRRSLTGVRSAAEETKETAMMSTPCLTEKSTQPRSDSVAAAQPDRPVGEVDELVLLQAGDARPGDRDRLAVALDLPRGEGHVHAG